MSALLTREVALGCDRMGCTSEATLRARSQSVAAAFVEARNQAHARGWRYSARDGDVCPTCVASEAAR